VSSGGEDTFTSTVDGAAAHARQFADLEGDTFDGYEPDLDEIERTPGNACPECATGVAVVGAYDRETGCTEGFCSHGCGWSV